MGVLYGLWAQGRSEREAHAARAVEQTALAVRDLLLHADPLDLPQRARSLVAPLRDASVGWCDGGEIAVHLATAVPGPSGRVHGPHRSSHGMLPLDRDVVHALCRAHRPGPMSVTRFVAPRDLLRVAVCDAGARRAWALVRIPNRADDPLPPRLQLLFATAVLAVLALGVFTGDTLRRLRRGVSLLESSLAALPTDLGYPIADPRMSELSALRDAIARMALGLREASARERALEHRVEHHRRLAGLGRVVAGVAHDVRNPLAAMKLKLDAMARRALDPRSRGDVAVCLEEVARLDDIVTNLLVASRSSVTSRARVPLAALVDRRIAVMGTRRVNGVTLERTGDATVTGHEGDLARAIDNLLHNACAASPADHAVRVHIALDGAWAEVTVNDGGPGVSPELMPHLFEPFVTGRAEGSGLGLFVANAVARAHGGTLRYERIDGRTVFTLRLPGGDRDG